MAAATTDPKDAITAFASSVSSQPLFCSDHLVWGVLTAVSTNARNRPQGIDLLLTAEEHCIGRIVEDAKFRIDSNTVSGFHCKIFKKKACNEDTESSSGAFLIDSSSNGTYLNWERLKRGSPKVEAVLRHGDIVSFAAPPQHAKAFAFVYREVQSSVSMVDSTVLKRKTKELGTQNKRLKGIGIGAPEGPVSVDDFQSLQCLNALEEHVCNIDSLRNELIDANKASAEEKKANEDLKEKLSSALQSCTEANEIIESQKASMAKLQTQLDEERDQRREEREKAAADLKAFVRKVQSEENLLSDAASKREREQQEVIHKLQESKRESSSLVESLRLKLEEARQKLVLSENKVRQLEAQLFEEREASDLRKKAAQEETWVKVYTLEREINEIGRDLEAKKQRLKGAKERIMLRKIQLRSFYSTTEEIQMLFAKQQEQLKTMHRTIKNEEDYDVSLDISLNETVGIHDRNASLRCPSTSARRFDPVNTGETSRDEVSATDKHACNTQEAEFPNDDAMVNDGFGSDIDGVGTAPAFEGDDDGTEQVLETASLGVDGEKNSDLNKFGNSAGDTMHLEDGTNMQETEHQVPSSLGIDDSEKNNDLNKLGNSAEHIMHLKDDTNMQEIEHKFPSRYEHNYHFNLNNQEEVMKKMKKNAEGIRTQDLMTSEVGGRWANITGPSVYVENESPYKDNGKDADAVNNGLNTQVAEFDGNPSVSATEMNLDHEHVVLCNMIGIIVPDVKEQFGSVVDVDSVKNIKVSDSDSETGDENADGDGGDCDVGVGSYEERQADYQADENGGSEDVMYEDDDEYVTEPDSVS